MWGWVVRLVPVRQEECSHPQPFRLYACFDRDGNTDPVGTRGVWGVRTFRDYVNPADVRGLSPSQVEELWEGLVRPWDSIVLTPARPSKLSF